MKITQKPSLKHLQNENLFLRNTNKNLQKELLKFKNQNALIQQKYEDIKQQLEWFQRQLFGKKSERILSPSNEEQLYFEGMKPQEEQLEETQTIKEHKRKKQKRNGKYKISLPDDLPIKTYLLDLPEEEKICPITKKPLIKIGEEISDKLAYIHGSYYIKRFIRPKYSNKEQIFTSEMPDSILPKCKADESFLSDILVKKFADHLPLYRISEIFQREHIFIHRKLLSQWVVKIGTNLYPLYKEMLKQTLSSGCIFMDEIPVKMLQPIKCKHSYIWSVSNHKYKIYRFKEDRKHQNVQDILGNYQGILHSDKYAAYENLSLEKGIIWCPCWAHIRRKFFEINTDPPIKKWILQKIRYLFMLERIALSRDENQRLKIRQEIEASIIDEIIEKVKEKLSEPNLLPKASLTKALRYLYNLSPHLKNYINYSDARLDNNTAERAVRPFAIGRKNWLFLGSQNGGKAASVIMSLVQTCRSLGINPREYLEDIMRKIMSHNSQKLYELLPDRWKQKYFG